MNIALVMERLEPWRGGAETSTHQFMQHLLAMGHTLELFTRSRLSPAPGIQVHVITSPARTRTGRTLWFSRTVDRRLAQADVDVVHAISPCVSADVYEPRGGTIVETIARNLALRRSRAGRSVKRLTNRLNFRQRYLLELERRLLSRQPRPIVVALSDYVTDQLHRHYAYPDADIRKVFNGVDPDTDNADQRRRDRQEIRQTYDIADDELLVIQVAHNFKLKGLGRWIEALGRLVGPDGVKVQSLVVGRGNPVRWERAVEAHGLSDRLRFAGPTGRVRAFYHAADVLVHPTYYDPCSRVVLEAMSSGLPCVTTRYDGAAERIESGVSGFVLDSPEDVDGLAAAVRRLTDADLRVRLGRAAAERVQEASMRRHTEELLAVYALAAQRKTMA